MQKPLWVKSSREDFDSFIKDVVNKLDDDNCITTVKNHE